uniref:Uncharacterized protein n=1 Tax=Arundo donax TaxID=35708 RepID=A0A0A9CGB4_ARUDO
MPHLRVTKLCTSTYYTSISRLNIAHTDLSFNIISFY